MSAERTFGNWLRQSRNNAGITQENLAERLGFSPALLRKLESGERRPSGQIASLLAEFFGVPEDERQAFLAFARSEPVTVDPTTGIDRAELGNLNMRAPWRRSYAHRTNLLARIAPIIGRERDAVDVRDLLLHPKTRLLTLVGTAGIGKTSLALHVAASLLDRFDDGVFFVDLTPVVDPEAVLPTLARTLGLQQEGNRPIDEVLLDYARGRRMLLVLDNFEQVLDGSIAVVRLMEASPWLKVLVTSREALHVRGERRFLVPALAFPDPRRAPVLSVMASYASVELFVERARAVSSGFSLTEENGAAVAAICAALQGLPLAIELAAARSDHLSPAEIVAELNNPLKLLAGGPRDMPARHRTLRNAIEWSYDLLNSAEQGLFRHLSVFAEGFTLDAVESICSGGLAFDVSVLGMLLSLIDKHLVYRENSTGRQARFGMLAAVREFALEQTGKPSEADDLARRHAAYYSSLAERAEQHFTGPQYQGWGNEQIEWVNRLEADLGNMRAALDWYRDQAQTARRTAGAAIDAMALESVHRGLQLATALRRVWLARGYFVEGSYWLRTFLALVPAPLPIEAREFRAVYGQALLVQARLMLLQGGEAAVSLLLADSRSIAADLGDKQQLAAALFTSGSVALAEGDYATARSYEDECLQLFRELGHTWGAAAALEDLGNIEISEGNWVPGRQCFSESLALYREVGEYFGAASALEGLGRASYYCGDYASANELWEESLHLREETGYRSKACNSLVLLGWAALRQGKHSDAERLLRSGLTSAKELGATLTVHWGLIGLGVWSCAQGRIEKGVRLLGAADALREARSIGLSPNEEVELSAAIASARAHLTADKWQLAWEKGRAARLEDLILSA